MQRVKKTILGENLKRLREARGLNQTQLAAKSGIHRTSINRIEQGEQERMLTDSLTILAEALGVTTDDLTDPAGISPIADLVPELEQSGLLVPPLTDEERAWLLSIPAAVWIGQEPSAASLYHMVQARRSGAPRQG